MLSITSQEADVERLFSIINLIIGDDKDRLGTDSIFYMTAKKMY